MKITPEHVFLTMVGITLLLLFSLFACAVMQPYFESRTYNKLTGAHTTYWDAVWVELRVQDSPKDK